ncbi:peptidoglycan DD-metalloendopeptidase family protein [Nonomuraea sp. SMC257]|uniref:Peptidoglycan DD-metalloendopeptidase family protein n=2 Tax=Nonomuraea montanisoli TaxID=2741721 RepID=A0A7Y6IGR1_9ACTN|nr:peptidoglycan DD-metalloendopeptidase family protein [Nonomuraea montanisoli]
MLLLLVVVAFIPLLPASPAAAAPAVWRWPVEGRPRIVRPFAPPRERWLAGHRGIDLAAPPATPVLAAGAGTVRYAGRLAGRGVVSVEHPGGLRTTYLPVAPSVRRGQRVSPGDRLGTLEESAGHCAESCLHWGLIRPPRYLDPLLLLGQARIRLLPFWTPEPRIDEAGPLDDLLPGPSGASLASPGVEAGGRPTDSLITAPSTAPPPTSSPWATPKVPATPPEPPAAHETHDIVPAGYVANSAERPTPRTTEPHQPMVPAPRMIASARTTRHTWTDDHAQAQGHDVARVGRRDARAEEERQSDDTAAVAAVAVRPDIPTSSTSPLPMQHPDLLLTALTSPLPCASPEASPRTPSSAYTVWSLRFPHGPAAAPAAGALGTATILAGLLLVILLRHRKPRSRRIKPKPRCQPVRGVHRKRPRSPRNAADSRRTSKERDRQQTQL